MPGRKAFHKNENFSSLITMEYIANSFVFNYMIQINEFIDGRGYQNFGKSLIEFY